MGPGTILTLFPRSGATTILNRMGRKSAKAKVSVRVPAPAVSAPKQPTACALAPLPKGYQPGRPVVGKWVGDTWSSQYTKTHPGPVDLRAFIDAWDDENPDKHRPNMAGAGTLGGYSRPVYGTSTPTGGVRESADVAQGRLNGIKSIYYSDLVGTNTIGKCCEYVTLPGQFTRAAASESVSGLRTLYTEARQFNTKKLRSLCEACRGFVSNAVNLHPGLRIVDRGGDNAIYESVFTAQCFEQLNLGVSEAEIELCLRAEALAISVENGVKSRPEAQSKSKKKKGKNARS